MTVNNAVWSYWNKPRLQNTSWKWHSDKNFWLCWILSVMEAQRFFKKLILCSDYETAYILTHLLQLPFDHVEILDDDFSNYDTSWWIIGKAFAYLKQKDPFIHLENDAFLGKSLPEKLLGSPLFAQNPEYFLADKSPHYNFELFDQPEIQGVLPVEWKWARQLFNNHQSAIACGFFGGSHLDFIHYYASEMVKTITNLQPLLATTSPADSLQQVLMVEQFFLSALLNYHQSQPNSKFSNLRIAYLFPSLESALQSTNQYGYTHLIGPVKNNPVIQARIEEKVAANYPKFYKACLNLTIDKCK